MQKKTNFSFAFNKKFNQRVLVFFLFIFSIYCSLALGRTWDEGAHLKLGKITLDYLFSLGRIDNEFIYREHYSPIYWTLKYLLTKIFPNQYQIEANHLVNLSFSLFAIFGISQLCKELFNKKIGKIVFLVLFFYPVFFGHMSFNSKDIFLAFCHVWIFYLIIRYLKKQDIKYKRNSYIIFLGIILASAAGLELAFFGTLIPIFIFLLIELFFCKKIITSKFENKKFYIDILKVFLIFYFFLVFFWIDAHPNIFILPFNFFLEHFSLVSGENWRGWPNNLLNGKYYLASQTPKLYFLINLIYKSPEYFLLCYVIFFIIFLKSNIFFKKKFQFFNYKLILLISIMSISIIIGFITPLKYDGMRHILWSVPYFCVIPGLVIYYLFENLNLLKSKITLISLSFFIVYFLFNFFVITPYQYTYLNFFNGKVENRYKKFENDYWGASIAELIKKTELTHSSIIKISTCGVSIPAVKQYFKNKGYSNIDFVSSDEADYIIMTNRVTFYDLKAENFQLTTCFEKFKGNDVYNVKRNGLILSTIRKI